MLPFLSSFSRLLLNGLCHSDSEFCTRLPSFTSLCHCLLKVSPLTGLSFHPSWGMEGWRYGWRAAGMWTEAVWSCSLPEEPLLPAQCHRSTVSQPAVHWPHPSLTLSVSLTLYFCLSLSCFPSLPEALAVPMFPSYANCLSCYQRCMSVWQPLCLPFCLLLCMPVYYSSSPPPVCLLLSLCLCLCAWVPACPSACLPASHSFQPIPLWRKAARLSAALPICLTICLSIRHLFVSLFVCLLVYLPVYLSACPSVSYLFVGPSYCMSVCLEVLCKMAKHEPLTPFYSSLYSLQFQKYLLTWQEKGMVLWMEPKSHLFRFVALTLHDLSTPGQHCATSLYSQNGTSGLCSYLILRSPHCLQKLLQY